MTDPLAPKSLEEWRAESDAQKRAETAAVMAAADAAVEAMAAGGSGAEAWSEELSRQRAMVNDYRSRRNAAMQQAMMNAAQDQAGLFGLTPWQENGIWRNS